jgi:hypothetical protein
MVAPSRVVVDAVIVKASSHLANDVWSADRGASSASTDGSESDAVRAQR